MNTQDIKKSFGENILKEDTVGQIIKASELASNKEIAKEVLKYGNVPVYYVPTKSMLKKPQEPGLIHLIANAMTITEINNLLKNGKEKYKNVSTGTIRKWEKAAKRRLENLNILCS